MFIVFAMNTFCIIGNLSYYKAKNNKMPVKNFGFAEMHMGVSIAFCFFLQPCTGLKLNVILRGGGDEAALFYNKERIGFDGIAKRTAEGYQNKI